MTIKKPIPVAVIGAGNMGSNHIRVYDELPESRLVEVVESDTQRATEIRQKYDGVDVYDSITDIKKAEAATIAVPNKLHRELAETAIRAGLDILVEKPLATTVADAEAIMNIAADHDTVLQVGHIERFNPAVNTLQDILADEELIALEAHRLGPFNEHLSDQSVIFDLMIHDLDIINSLINATLKTITAVGTRSRSDELDHAIGHLQYENGILGSATASHVTHDKVRELKITARDVFVELDYQNQKIIVNRRGLGQTTTIEGQSGYRTEKISETPFVSTREPLKNELEHFIKCVRTRSTPKVSSEQGVEAVRIARMVIDRIRENS